jgi:glutathione peroxidase
MVIDLGLHGNDSAARTRRWCPPRCSDHTTERNDVSDLLNQPVTTLDGEVTTFGELTGGRTALVVNVASKCGLTPQYAKLEALHEALGDRGFTVVGFPCNQFHGQEPGTDEQIAEFCSTTYGVTFPMSSKIEVNGPGRDPIYSILTASSGEPEDIRWNFEKFLVSADGRVLARFSPQTEPDAPEITSAIEGALT